MSMSSQLSIHPQSVMESMILVLDQSSTETQECIKSLEVATDAFRNAATNINEKLIAENKKLQALVIELQGQQVALISAHNAEAKTLTDRVSTLSVESDIQRHTHELQKEQINLLTAENSKFMIQHDYNKTPDGLYAGMQAYHQLPNEVKSKYVIANMKGRFIK